MSNFDDQCAVTNTVRIPPSVIQSLHSIDTPKDQDNLSGTTQYTSTLGGVTSNLQYAWFANGPHFQVVDIKSGERVAAWLFGGVLRDKQTRVTCVTELTDGFGNTPLFVVGLQCDLTGGMICIFDINGSKVLRAIQLNDKVSSLLVLSPGSAIDEFVNLPGMLKILDGVLAVGTVGGDIYLLDICKSMWSDELNPSCDELNVCDLLVHRCEHLNLPQLQSLKAHAHHQNGHLALQINGTGPPNFQLWTVLDRPRNSVHVSALLYVPKLISLFVGYNVGLWQIYNLLTMELEYTSALYEEMVPISHFAYQEPSDDPRAYCYMWVVYSKDAHAEHRTDPIAAMYALAFENKTNVENFGVFYQKFISCSLRFQMDLIPFSDVSSRQGGHCISVQSYVKNIPTYVVDTSDQRLSLCMIVWSSWPVHAATPDILMAIIDLDQWYKEQMPAGLRGASGNESYIVKFNLSKLLRIDNKDEIMDVKIDVSSLSPFRAAQRLEEHYYPSALAFDFICMQASSLSFLKNNGLQRNLLLMLEKNGVDGFLSPHRFAEECMEAGLQAIGSDATPRAKATPHEQLLSLALEYNVIGLLTACAKQWATGVYASMGCTLGMFVQWAAQRSEILQQEANELCVSLFDYSGVSLDCNARRLLDQCARQLHHLAIVFKVIIKSCSQYLNVQGMSEISDQLRALQMVSSHLEVLQWLLNVGLLPEAPPNSFKVPSNPSELIRAPYPAETLTRYYSDRRAELNRICGVPEKEARNRPCELLFIDNLIEHECGGQKLQREWKKDSQNENDTGLYPPRSLQTLLRTYLLDGVELHHKHTVLVYVFLDLAMTLDQARYSSIITHLIKFPAVFRLTPSHIKITQAFWQLDHGDFATGMEQLLDPLVRGSSLDDLRPWQHRTVLRVLMTHQQHKFAALYLQVRQPPLTDVDEICDAMDVLLANRMLHAAYQFQRRHRTAYNTKRILTRFFNSCLKTKLRTPMLKLSLSTEEENVLLEILSANNFVGNNLQLMYYLQRSRGLEAAQMLKSKKPSTKVTRQGLIGQQTIELPEILLATYMNAMPKVTKTLFEQCQVFSEKGSWSEVQKPTPMSVNVVNGTRGLRYKSNIIAESIAKVYEVWSDKTLVLDVIKKPQDIEATPFLCTPKKMLPTAEPVNPITYPKITYQSLTKLGPYEINAKKRPTSENPDESGMVCAKRIRYDDNVVIHENYTAPEKLLLTPVVKRLSSTYASNSQKKNSNAAMNCFTPQGILKTSKINSSTSYAVAEKARGGTVTPPEVGDCDRSSMDMDSTPSLSPNDNSEHVKSNRVSLLGATPRKMLIRTPKPAVHFEDFPNDLDLSDQNRSSISNKEKITMDLTSSSSLQDDVFYSPTSSLSDDIWDEKSDEMKNVNQSLTEQVHLEVSPRRSLRNAQKLSVKYDDHSKELVKSTSDNGSNKITSNVYKNVKSRKSLQRKVLENSLAKNIISGIHSPSPLVQKILTSTPRTRFSYKLRSTESSDTTETNKDVNCFDEEPRLLDDNSFISESFKNRFRGTTEQMNVSEITLKETTVPNKNASCTLSTCYSDSIVSTDQSAMSCSDDEEEASKLLEGQETKPSVRRGERLLSDRSSINESYLQKYVYVNQNSLNEQEKQDCKDELTDKHKENPEIIPNETSANPNSSNAMSSCHSYSMVSTDPSVVSSSDNVEEASKLLEVEETKSSVRHWDRLLSDNSSINESYLQKYLYVNQNLPSELEKHEDFKDGANKRAFTNKHKEKLDIEFDNAKNMSDCFEKHEDIVNTTLGSSKRNKEEILEIFVDEALCDDVLKNEDITEQMNMIVEEADESDNGSDEASITSEEKLTPEDIVEDVLSVQTISSDDSDEKESNSPLSNLQSESGNEIEYNRESVSPDNESTNNGESSDTESSEMENLHLEEEVNEEGSYESDNSNLNSDEDEQEFSEIDRNEEQINDPDLVVEISSDENSESSETEEDNILNKRLEINEDASTGSSSLNEKSEKATVVGSYSSPENIDGINDEVYSDLNVKDDLLDGDVPIEDKELQTETLFVNEVLIPFTLNQLPSENPQMESVFDKKYEKPSNEDNISETLTAPPLISRVSEEIEMKTEIQDVLNLEQQIMDDSLISADRTPIVVAEMSALITDDESDLSLHKGSPLKKNLTDQLTNIAHVKEKEQIAGESDLIKSLHINAQKLDNVCANEPRPVENQPDTLIENSDKSEIKIGVVSNISLSENETNLINSSTKSRLRNTRATSVSDIQISLSDSSTSRWKKRPASLSGANTKNVIITHPKLRSVKKSSFRKPINQDEQAPIESAHNMSTIQESTESNQQDVLPAPEESAVVGTRDELTKTSKIKQKKKTGTKSVTSVSTVSGSNALEEYSTTRRLTRRQRSLLSKSIDVSVSYPKKDLDFSRCSSEEDIEIRGPDLEMIDPIKLLDKPDFQGEPDPEELKILDYSPTSSIKTISSVVSEGRTFKIQTRSQNTESEASSLPRTPTRQLRSRTPSIGTMSPAHGPSKLITYPLEVLATPPRRSSRRLSQTSIQHTPDSDEASETASVASKNSRISSRALVAQQLLEGPGTEAKRSTRSSKKLISPTKDETNVKSDNDSSLQPYVKITGQANRRSIIRSNFGLASIEERGENSKEVMLSDSPPKKRGRPKKNEMENLSTANIFVNPLIEEVQQRGKKEDRSKRATSTEPIRTSSRRTSFRMSRHRNSTSSDQ